MSIVVVFFYPPLDGLTYIIDLQGKLSCVTMFPLTSYGLRGKFIFGPRPYISYVRALAFSVNPHKSGGAPNLFLATKKTAWKQPLPLSVECTP